MLFTLSAVAVAAAVALAILDDWFVNFDGGGYLALAKSLVSGDGFVFPDGSFGNVRGPGYPTLLSLPWLVSEPSAQSAMWASRAVLGANALLISWIGTQLSGRAIVGVVIGVAAVIQPLPLVSGGLYLVPDAFAMGVGIAAMAISFSQRIRSRWVIAGVLVGLAGLTKETALLFVILIPLIHAVAVSIGAATRGLMRFASGFSLTTLLWLIVALLSAKAVPGPFGGVEWLVVIAAPALTAFVLQRSSLERRAERLGTWSLVAFAGLLMVALETRVSRPLRSWGVVWEELLNDLDAQLYRDSPWAIVLIPFVIGIAWAVWRRRNRLVVVGLGLILGGVPLILYAVRLGGGLRNGVLVAYGAAVLIGAALIEFHPGQRPGLRYGLVAVTLAVLGMFVVGSGLAALETNNRLDERLLTSDSAATRLAAEYLATLDEPISVTPVFASTLWFLGGSEVEVHMAPMHQAVDSAGSFDVTAWWLGTRAEPGPDAEEPVAAVVARTSTTAFFRTTLTGHLAETSSQYLAVTGNLATISSAFDGGILLPALERDVNATRVYSTDDVHLPQWTVVYRIDGPLTLPGPTYIHLVFDNDVTDLADNPEVVNRTEYQKMILAVLARPLEDEVG